jgi:anion-transporting  ArsA/GET3 family ATPase
MEEYLRVKTGRLGEALGHSRAFQVFAMATPGMRELLSVGKVWELAQPRRRTRGAAPYDLVIVDAPATGHGVGILRTPRTFAEIARLGPVAHQARTIAATIADPKQTAVIVVSTAEEMPVNETLVLRDELAGEGLALDAVILNALYPNRFEREELAEITTSLRRSRSPLVRSALRAATSEHARAAIQREQRERLSEGLDVPIAELPFVFADHLQQPELELLADALASGLLGQNGAGPKR